MEINKLLIYICVIIYTCLMARFYLKSNFRVKYKLGTRIRQTNHSFTLFILSVLPAIFVAGIRYGISIDYPMYSDIYSLISERIYSGQIVQVEIGFQVLCRLLSFFSSNSVLMFVVTSAMIVTSIFFASLLNSKDYVLSVMMFFLSGVYFDTFNGIRQYIAIGFFLIAIKYVEEENFVRYTLLLLIGSLFHTSCLFMIPAYFLKNFRFRPVLAVGIGVVVLVLKNVVLKLAMLLISKIPKYSAYILRNTVGNQIQFTASGMLFSAIVLCALFVVISEIRKTKIGNFYCNMALIGVLVALLSGVIPFSDRILYYTKSLYILSVPYIVSCAKNERDQAILKFGILGSFGVLNICGMLLKNWYAVLPYVTIFS